MSEEKDSLVALWTSGDKEVALNMLFMYLLNSKKRGWWDEVTLILWGPSQELTLNNEEVKEGLIEMREEGVNLEACVVCAREYGVVSELEALGVDVYGMGEPLTKYLKGDEKVITF
ncbi:MAG: DsrE family protein [Candidatus Bipolaricaulota bacterium]